MIVFFIKKWYYKKMINEINIKSFNQTTSVALSQFLVEIDRCKFNDVKLLKVITGYGSHGVGGEIKRELLYLCLDLKRKGIIKNYIPCEKLTKSSLHSLCVDYPDLILDTEISSYNSGVVLVEI